MSRARPPSAWDYQADVIVVGSGFAGATAAIAAHDAGARVLILEKLAHPGGLSVLSGGGILTATDPTGAFECVRSACDGRTPDDVVRVFADGICELGPWLQELAAASGTELVVEETRHGGTYPLPGSSSLRPVKIANIERADLFPWAHGLRGGARLFHVAWDNVSRRSRIETRYETPVSRLLTGLSGEVVGVRARARGRSVEIKARKAVILATGGFEFDDTLKADHFQARPVHGVGGLGNTGDGVRLAQSVGARLWHMWHYHGSYGFRFDPYPYAFRHRFPGSRKPGVVMPWIVVDRDGRRFMNEFHPSPNDTNARPLDLYDPDRVEFPRIPSFLIFDEAGRRRGPIAFPVSSGGPAYEWSPDNSREIERGWILKQHSLDELEGVLNRTGTAHIRPGTLRRTVGRWNEQVSAGSDADHQRPIDTGVAIAEPPYHAVPVWPIVSNTQGGPVHDTRQRVLDPWGEPIPRLYAVGELGSLFGHLYVLNGNLSECFIGGRIAGQDAALLGHWDARRRVATPARTAVPRGAAASGEAGSGSAVTP